MLNIKYFIWKYHSRDIVNSYSYSIYLRDVNIVHSVLFIVFLDTVKFA